MSKTLEVLALTPMVFIPFLGSHPAIARFLCLGTGSRLILAILAGVAFSSAVVWLIGLVDLPVVVVLVSPLYQVMLLSFLYHRFRNVHGREPIDVAFNWESGLFHDRIFALSNAFGGFFPPFMLLMWSVGRL